MIVFMKEIEANKDQSKENWISKKGLPTLLMKTRKRSFPETGRNARDTLRTANNRGEQD